MDSHIEDARVLRRYLLRQATADEVRQIDWRRTADPEYQELVDAVEQELIDDFLRGALGSEEKALFQKLYFEDESQRAKVEQSRVVLDVIRKRDTRLWMPWLVAIVGWLLVAALGYVHWGMPEQELVAHLREGSLRSIGDASAPLVLTSRTHILRLHLQLDRPTTVDSAILRTTAPTKELLRLSLPSAQPTDRIALSLPTDILPSGSFLVQLESSGRVEATFVLHIRRKY